jgi:hypothetical protein
MTPATDSALDRADALQLAAPEDDAPPLQHTECSDAVLAPHGTTMCSLLATDNGVSTDLSLRDLTSEDIAELTNLILIDATAASVLTALEQPPTLDQEQQSEERRTSTPQPVAARKKPIRWDPNRARNQRKQELIYLRKQVADLETQLTAVQAKKPRLGDAQREPTVSDESTSIVAKAVRETSVIATAWHQIARRQNQKRVEVERENVRLRVVLENQLKIAKSLESFLIRKIATKAVRTCAIPSQTNETNSSLVCFACAFAGKNDTPYSAEASLPHVPSDKGPSHRFRDF